MAGKPRNARSKVKTKQEEPVFCLFHEKTDCNCIKPVTDFETLKYRQESDARLREMNEKYERGNK